jgi:hypothetical protein
MKKLDDLINVNNIAAQADSKELVTVDIDKLLKRIEIDINDYRVQVLINIKKESSFIFRTHEEKYFYLYAKKSLFEAELRSVMKKHYSEWIVDKIHDHVKLPIILPNKQELIALKKHLVLQNVNNKEKIKVLNDMISAFIVGYETYGNIDKYIIAYNDKLLIYPISYLQKALKISVWKQKKLPTISEIEEFLRHCDGDKSQIFYAINQQVTEPTDYNDDILDWQQEIVDKCVLGEK